MPLLDHFDPPLRRNPHFESVNHTWATCIAQHLNGSVLPPRYRAQPETTLGINLEAGVATFEGEQRTETGDGNGAVATVVWAPPRPPLVVPVDLANLDVFEVQVYDDEGQRWLVAAIELVSPSNKDRPVTRRAFAAKCAAYLQNDVSVVVVDIVTERRDNLHAEFMELLQLGESARNAVASGLYAIAYRFVKAGQRVQLEAWPSLLTIGSTLPTLPLWLSEELAVPLDLETSYRAMCTSLRIRT
jgi:hypothetical protein